MLELNSLKQCLPKSLQSYITQDFLNRLEQSLSSPEYAEIFKDNFLTYSNVLAEGKYTLEQYVGAVKFVSFKLMGYSDVNSYACAFPEKFQKMKEDGRSESYISGVISVYKSGKLVTRIFEQTIVPTYVLNAPLHQEALNKLAEVMRDERTKPLVKVKACEAILNYTKQPEVVKGELKIDMQQSDTIGELRAVADRMAETLKATLEHKGMSLKEIAEGKIIDVEVEDD